MKAPLVVYQVQYRKQICHEAPVKIVDFKKGTNKKFSPNPCSRIASKSI